MGWAKNILYLTENDILNGQAIAACREFPDLRCASLSDKKAAADADVLVTSYDALLAEADDLYDGDAHLLTPGRFDLILVDEADAVLAFDERMLQLMLARAQRRTDAAVTALLNELIDDVRALAGRASLKKVAQQKKRLNRILHNGYAAEASLPELEEIRLALRPLILYLPPVKEPIPLPFADRPIDVLPIDLHRTKK